jgi:hypothetical protein
VGSSPPAEDATSIAFRRSLITEGVCLGLLAGQVPPPSLPLIKARRPRRGGKRRPTGGEIHHRMARRTLKVLWSPQLSGALGDGSLRREFVTACGMIS